MDPDRSESAWVARGRAVGSFLVGWFGISFVLSIVIYLWIRGPVWPRDPGLIRMFAPTASLTGIGLLLVLLLRKKAR